MNGLKEFLDREVLLDRTVGQFLFCLGGMLATLLGRWLLVVLAETKVRRLAERTTATWDDLLLKKARRPVSALLVVLGVYASLQFLQPNERLSAWIGGATTVLSGIALLFLLGGLVDVLIDAYRPLRPKLDSRLDDAILPVVRRILKIALALVIVLMVLQHLNVRIDTLLTTAGLGGIAVAFGAQKVIANFFASVTIFSDQPFQIGERIRVSGIVGVVEEIGLRSTKVRDDDGVLVTVPNTIVAESIVENQSRRPSRRVVTKIGLTFDTPPEKLDQSRQIVADILAADPDLEDRRSIHFAGFSDWSLDIQIVYWVKGGGLENHVLVQDRINSEILRRFNEADIEMAFPTRTIYHKQAEPHHPTRRGQS